MAHTLQQTIPLKQDASIQSLINELHECRKKRRKSTKQIDRMSLVTEQPSLLELPLQPIVTCGDLDDLVSKPKTLRNWCTNLGFVLNRIECVRCNSLAKLQMNCNKLYWVCSSGRHLRCPFQAKVEIPFMSWGLDVKKLITFLFMWFNRVPENRIMRKILIKRENYRLMHRNIIEACTSACAKVSQEVGGPNVRINVEIAKSFQDDNQVVIGGMEDKNYKMLFLTHLNTDIKSFSQLKELIDKWILPGSIVHSNSVMPEALAEMGWKESGSWTLNSNSGSLVEDLLRQFLSTHKHPFEEFVKSICEYNKDVYSIKEAASR